MYFLSPEEQKYVTRKLLMDARRDEVHPDLRGWNWAQPPLVAFYRSHLGISDIASLYCATGKDTYLKKVAKMGFRANEAMVEGLLLHRIISEVFTKAKVLIYKMPDLTSHEFMRELGEIDVEREARIWGFWKPRGLKDGTSLESRDGRERQPPLGIRKDEDCLSDRRYSI